MSGAKMSKLLEGIKGDIRFVRSQTLQPEWFKVLKVFLLVGFLLVYWSMFGLRRSAVFLAVFLLLSLAVHILYRKMTRAWTRSWLDFVVVHQGDIPVPRRIGAFYYTAVVVNASISIVISQLLR
jgi:hypothetical protein